jgi:glucose-6-phosphate isomerase
LRVSELKSLGPIEERVRARLAALEHERVVERIRAGDHTVWKPDPSEISNRLGWLTVAGEMAGRVAELEAFAAEAAAEGFATAVLLGMGGSSLAPEVMRLSLGVAPGKLDLKVLDSTDPGQVLELERSLELARTLFIVSSKSGGTIETRAQYAYFRERAGNPRQFVAITDHGSSLERDARADGAMAVFLNPPEIGGRYSALSLFGLVPGALIGADVRGLLSAAGAMFDACGPGVPSAGNPGVLLGAVMGEAALAGRDKLTLVLPAGIRSLGTWIEQLIAESTGKEGRGILPVEGEPLGPPGVYGEDRLFVSPGDDPGLAALQAAGHPVFRIPFAGADQLGAEFARWEFATAVAGHILGVNPFDQPNVQEAKDATANVLGGGAVPMNLATFASVLEEVGPADYIAITAYVARNEANSARLERARVQLRDRYRVATTAGFGPRFLHSTGQYHKGGPNTGVFLQVRDEHPEDVAIPGEPYTFAGLQQAQAFGDAVSLLRHGRRVGRGTLADLDSVAR